MANEVTLPQLTTSVQIGKAMVFTGSLFVANSMKAISMIQGPVRGAHSATLNDLLLEDQTGPAVLDRQVMGEGMQIVAPLVAPFGKEFHSFVQAISPTGKRTIGSSNPIQAAETCVAVIPSKQIGGGLKYDGATGVWSRLAGQGVSAAAPSTVTVAGGGAALAATSIPVTALTAAIPSGTRLIFSGGATHTARLTAAAALGATSLTVAALPVALLAAETAQVSHPDAIPYNAGFMFRGSPDYDEFGYSPDAGGRQIPTVTFTGMYSLQAGLPDDMHVGVWGDPMGYDLATVPTTFQFSAA